MAEFIKVKAELDECMKFLENLDGNKKSMRRRILSATGTAVKNKVKKSYRGLLNKHSGNLYKSLKSRVIKAGNAAVVILMLKETKSAMVLFLQKALR